jgi:hypothetical protein
MNNRLNSLHALSALIAAVFGYMLGHTVATNRAADAIRKFADAIKAEKAVGLTPPNDYTYLTRGQVQGYVDRGEAVPMHRHYSVPESGCLLTMKPEPAK